MRLTPGRLMLLSLVGGMAVMSLGAWLGGRCATEPTATKTYRIVGPAGDLYLEPWGGPVLHAFPWLFAGCGLTFIGAVLWLARVETRGDRAK